MLSSTGLNGLLSAEEINSMTLWLRRSRHRQQMNTLFNAHEYQWCVLITAHSYTSHSDNLAVVLTEMLLASHEFFWGFGDSKRFTISCITSVGMGSDLLWFLLMQDSKSQWRYTWQKPSESKETTDSTKRTILKTACKQFCPFYSSFLKIHPVKLQMCIQANGL